MILLGFLMYFIEYKIVNVGNKAIEKKKRGIPTMKRSDAGHPLSAIPAFAHACAGHMRTKGKIHIFFIFCLCSS
jgi:hypothetical protein